MAVATFYYNDGLASNGHTYRQNLRRHGGIVATNLYADGTELILIGETGRRARVTVCDKVGHGTDYDLNPALFRRLCGPLKKGRGRVRARVVGRPHKQRRNIHKKGC